MTGTPYDIRPSEIAGHWYPGDPQQLAESVDSYISQAAVPEINGRLVAILAPHAGHRHSGPIAGHAFRALQAQALDIEIVALIGPSHYPYREHILTSAHDAYETPLGQVPVAHDLIEELSRSVPITPVREDPEHAIEIELPFLQRVLPDFRLIPLALMDQSWAMAQRLGEALAALLRDRKALLVASSDLSHRYPQGTANTLDQRVLDAINAFDPAAVIAAEAGGRKIACGHGALATVMIAARALGADAAQVINYATSGDTAPPYAVNRYASVVGYSAAVFYESAG